MFCFEVVYQTMEGNEACSFFSVRLQNDSAHLEQLQSDLSFFPFFFWKGGIKDHHLTSYYEKFCGSLQYFPQLLYRAIQNKMSTYSISKQWLQRAIQMQEGQLYLCFSKKHKKTFVEYYDCQLNQHHWSPAIHDVKKHVTRRLGL